MAPQKLVRFNNLPLEIRRRIWRLTVTPRIVRAKNDAYSTGKEYRPVYRLYAGIVPHLLHVNQESRTEGLRIYTAIASHLPFGITPYPTLPTSDKQTRTIYVDLARDTLYFTRIQNTIGFLGWLRLLGNESIGGAGTGEMKVKTSDTKTKGKKKRGIFSLDGKTVRQEQEQSLPRVQSQMPTPKPKPGLRHLAFPLQEILKQHKSQRLDFLLSIAMLQPHLSSISIVLNANTSKFNHQKSPQKFWLRAPKQLDVGTRGKRIFVDLLGTHKEGFYRDQIEAIFEGFWTRERSVGMKSWIVHTQMESIWLKWAAWIKSEERNEWQGAEFMLVDLAQAKGAVL